MTNILIYLAEAVNSDLPVDKAEKCEYSMCAIISIGIIDIIIVISYHNFPYPF